CSTLSPRFAKENALARRIRYTLETLPLFDFAAFHFPTLRWQADGNSSQLKVQAPHFQSSMRSAYHISCLIWLLSISAVIPRAMDSVQNTRSGKIKSSLITP